MIIDWRFELKHRHTYSRILLYSYLCQHETYRLKLFQIMQRVCFFSMYFLCTTIRSSIRGKDKTWKIGVTKQENILSIKNMYIIIWYIYDNNNSVRFVHFPINILLLWLFRVERISIEYRISLEIRQHISFRLRYHYQKLNSTLLGRVDKGLRWIVT